MNIQPIAYFESPLKQKFGVPRQSGLARRLPGRIILEPAYRREEALKGLEHFDYLWIIWGFSANKLKATKPLTVRPPRLGGNERVGVFASRSPYRPNAIGLSSVRLIGIDRDDRQGPVILCEGADLMDRTPIYDLKPYVTYTDAHPEARSGFVDEREWQELQVVMADGLRQRLPADEVESLLAVLRQDPRPQYHDDNERVYGMVFGRWNIRFRVADRLLTVTDIEAYK